MTDYAELVERLSFEQKTAINIEFERLYEAGVRAGYHGHFETMFAAMHEAYRPVVTTLVKARDEDYAIGLKLRQELAADNARLREALASVVTTTHRPNPTDPSRIDVAPGKHRQFQAAVERARAALAKPAPTTG